MEQNTSPLNTTPTYNEKKLRRSSDGAIIGGVCSGLGKYFGLDPWILRLIFIILTAVGGGGLLIYILLWLLVPHENSKVEKQLSCARVLALLAIVVAAIIALIFILTIFSIPSSQ